MGDWSVHCAISGLSIRGGDPVVGFKLQETSFKGEIYTSQYLPLSMPVVGYYDHCGGISTEKYSTDDLLGNGLRAIIHKDVWNELPKMWNPQDGAMPLIESFKEIHKEIHEEIANYKSLYEKDKKKIWKKWMDPLGVAHSCLTRPTFRGFVTWLDKIYLGEKSLDMGKSYKVRQHWSYKNCSGPFEKIVLQLAIDGPNDPMFAEKCDHLEKLVMAYSVQYITGRQITPIHLTHPEQYTQMIKEEKWFKFLADKAHEMRVEEKYKGDDDLEDDGI